MESAKLDFPATGRNREAIWSVLQPLLRPGAVILEVASGSGQHVACFAARSPDVRWQPSDPVEAHRQSIAAWCAGLENTLPPLNLDVQMETRWPRAQGVVAINLLHIAPWPVCPALFAGARQSGAEWVYLYGAYRRSSHPTAPSNEAFDASLRAQNPEWGVRHLEDVERCAADHGFWLDRLVEMPSNNLSLVFRRSGEHG